VKNPTILYAKGFILAFLVGCLLFLFLRSGQSHIDGQDPPLKAPFQSSDKPGSGK
jgi:hypothetical protein